MEGFHQGTGTRKIDRLWGQFSVTGLPIQCLGEFFLQRRSVQMALIYPPLKTSCPAENPNENSGEWQNPVKREQLHGN